MTTPTQDHLAAMWVALGQKPSAGRARWNCLTLEICADVRADRERQLKAAGCAPHYSAHQWNDLPDAVRAALERGAA